MDTGSGAQTPTNAGGPSSSGGWRGGSSSGGKGGSRRGGGGGRGGGPGRGVSSPFSFWEDASGLGVCQDGVLEGSTAAGLVELT